MRHQKDDRGAAAVEFALVFPILIVLLIGTVTSALSYSRAIAATNAVREGSRFGATADAASPSWESDLIARVRQTQFDDPGNETAVCVQLWKVGTGALRASCSGSLTMPPATDYPRVPDSLDVGLCVVRVVARRPYTINAIFTEWNSTMTKGAVARYERDSC